MGLIELVFLCYFGYVAFYSLTFSVAALFYSSGLRDKKEPTKKICVFIPSYKEDNIILDTAKAALKQDYPSDLYTVVVIADSLQPETIAELSQLPIRVIPVHFDKSTKVKSLNYAFSQLSDKFDYAVILDADNIMKSDFLVLLSQLLTENSVIQGQREAKNSNTMLAFLDGLSEAINTTIYRKGQYALGLSSSISGSGVIFPFQLLKDKLSTMDSVGGFDRELEVMLVREGIKVRYLQEAIVYDEKVSRSSTFQNQRRRWISSQYFYLRKYFGAGVKALFKGDFVYFNSAVLRNIQLPRLLNIGLMTIFTGLSILLSRYLYFGSEIWIVLFTILTVSVFLAIPRAYYSKKLLIAILNVPLIFLQMVFVMFKLKGANKTFLHTQKEATSTTTNRPE